MLLIHLAAANDLPGLAQAAVTLLAGTFGWILLGGLIIGGVICWFTRHHGAFAADIAFAALLAFFIFNPAGVTAIMQTTAKAL